MNLFTLKIVKLQHAIHTGDKIAAESAIHAEEEGLYFLIKVLQRKIMISVKQSSITICF